MEERPDGLHWLVIMFGRNYYIFVDVIDGHMNMETD